MPLTVAGQAMICILFPLVDCEPYIVLRSLIEKFYTKNEALAEEQSAMKKCLRRVVKASYFLFILNLLCILGPLTFSLYKTIETGQSVIPYPVIFPFVDPDSIHGFSMNFSFQAVLTAYAVFGFSILDGQTFLYVLHTQVFVDGLASKLKRFSDYVTTTSLTRKSRNDAKKAARNICDPR